MKETKLKFDCVRERYGSAGEEAAEALASMYLPATADWIASMWDGNVGAFYYSASARDNDGFLPDSESTQQAIGLLEILGVISGNSQLPAGMRLKMGEFAYKLQAPDGYFYHPQWKEMMLADPKRFSSRRGRDFGQCMWLLKSVSGIEPRYPSATDNLRKVRQGSTDSSINFVPDHLRSREAFKKYLEEMDINVGSYAKGHALSSQAGQIKAAGFADICIDYLVSKQNPENGTWEEKVNINSINGVTKIGTALTSLGALIPNASVSFLSAISVALSDEPCLAVTAAYNPLWTIEQMLGGFSRAGMDAELTEAKSALYKNGKELITKLYQKLLPYYYTPESAFHYCNDGSSSTSQNAPASMGVLEGDMNATSLGVDSIARLFRLLDLPVGRPCDKEDYDRVFKIIGE